MGGRSGKPSLGDKRLVCPIEVLHHLLGSKGEQHILVSNSNSSSSGGKQQQQVVQKSLRPHRVSQPAYD